MKISFQNRDLKSVIERIKENIPPDFVKSLEITSDPDFVYITLKKMGTSTFRYRWKNENSHLSWELDQEKLAFTHRQYYDKILGKIRSIIKRVDGVIEA